MEAVSEVLAACVEWTWNLPPQLRYFRQTFNVLPFPSSSPSINLDEKTPENVHQMVHIGYIFSLVVFWRCFFTFFFSALVEFALLSGHVLFFNLIRIIINLQSQDENPDFLIPSL